MKEFFGVVQELTKKLANYLNKVGQFYLQFQFIFRVIFVPVVLGDIFKLGPSLVCDTSQVGCKDMCMNRFAPITIEKLWQLELYYILFCTLIFIGFRFVNDRMWKHYNKHPEAYGGISRDILQLRTKTHRNKNETMAYSRLITLGYFTMLVCRLVGEVGFVYLERELATHQSGIRGGPIGLNAFMLPERYTCRTNMESDEYNALKDAQSYQRSSIFDITSELTACNQQKYEVVCWIPWSHMRQKGMIFMHLVLLMGACLTICELLYLIVRMFKKRGSVVHHKDTAHQILQIPVASEGDSLFKEPLPGSQTDKLA